MSSWSSESGCRAFTLAEIKKATDSFSGANFLGRGGEGIVFKGVLDHGGDKSSHVAVKRLTRLNQADFEKEIKMLSKLRHANLVSLVGYCQQSDEKILVYEFMPNGSLADHLYGKSGRSPALSWEQRLNISIGAARGLEYLHTGTSNTTKIIHRDVKCNNILLGGNQAKISDFGLSKKGPANQTRTSVSTALRGTIGYYAPEYVTCGRVTWRVDVFAFGVVLFELLCKKKPWERDASSTVDHHQNHKGESYREWAQRNVDPALKGAFSQSCIEVFLDVAENCLNRDPEKRPSMSEVVAELTRALKLQQKSDSEIRKSAHGEKRQADSARPSGGSSVLRHGDFQRSKSAKFEKNPQTETSISAEWESSTWQESTELVHHPTELASDKMKPKQKTRSSVVARYSEDGKNSSLASDEHGKTEEDTAITNSSKTNTADIPGTEDKVVLYCSYTGAGSTDYMKTRLYLKNIGVHIDEERDPTANQEYKVELSRFLAQIQKEFSLPQLFIGGKYVGGADEVVRLYGSGELGTFMLVH